MVWEGTALLTIDGERTRFRYKLSEVASEHTIWLENTKTKAQWTYDVESLADCGPKGYLSAALACSASAENAEDVGLALEKTTNGAELVAQLQLRLGNARWAPTYRFPLKNVNLNKVDILESKLQDYADGIVRPEFINVEIRFGTSHVPAPLSLSSTQEKSSDADSVFSVNNTGLTVKVEGTYLVQATISNPPTNCSVSLRRSERVVYSHLPSHVTYSISIFMVLSCKGGDTLTIQRECRCGNAHGGHMSVVLIGRSR